VFYRSPIPKGLNLELEPVFSNDLSEFEIAVFRYLQIGAY